MLTVVMAASPALASAREASALTSEEDRLSYARGMDLGK